MKALPLYIRRVFCGQSDLPQCVKTDPLLAIAFSISQLHVPFLPTTEVCHQL